MLPQYWKERKRRRCRDWPVPGQPFRGAPTGVHLVWQVLVFFTGALAPMTQPVLAAVARALPLGWGIACLRAIVVEAATAASLWHSGDLPGLLLNTAFYMALGAALFAWGERRARTLGVLGHY